MKEIFKGITTRIPIPRPDIKPIMASLSGYLVDRLRIVLSWPGRMLELVRNRRLALKRIDEGLQLLQGKLFSRGMLKFREAMSLSESTSMNRLTTQFSGFEADNEHESAYAVGISMLTTTPNDYVLATKLGNFSRKSRDFRQAGNLYKHALRTRKDYELALFNLAACLGRVDKYDHEIEESINKIDFSDEFILPPYQNNPDIVNKVIENILQQNIQKKKERIATLQEEQKKAEENIESYEVLKLGVLIKKTEETSVEPTYEEIRDRLNQLVERTAAENHKPESDRHYAGNLFNLGLYAFRNGDLKLAADSFEKSRRYLGNHELLQLLDTLMLHKKGLTVDAVSQSFDLLREDPFNRYLNINLGLLFRARGNTINSLRYLAVGADLLERSEGLFLVEDMMNLSAERERMGRYKKALKLLKVVCTEKNLKESWLMTGDILIKTRKHTEAIHAFRKVEELDPTCEDAIKKLQQIHDYFVSKSDEAKQDNRISQAAALCEKALDAKRQPDTVEKAILLFQNLKKTGKVQELIRERDELIQKERERAEEEQRQAYIRQSRLLLRRHAYLMAAEKLEKAFRMKVDESVFLKLVKLYKGMNMTGNVKSLIVRWEKMKTIEEEINAGQKDDRISESLQEAPPAD